MLDWAGRTIPDASKIYPELTRVDTHLDGTLFRGTRRTALYVQFPAVFRQDFNRFLRGCAFVHPIGVPRSRYRPEPY